MRRTTISILLAVGLVAVFAGPGEWLHGALEHRHAPTHQPGDSPRHGHDEGSSTCPTCLMLLATGLALTPPEAGVGRLAALTWHLGLPNFQIPVLRALRLPPGRGPPLFSR